MDEDARNLLARRKMARAAAQWALDNDKGAKAACNSGLFGSSKVVTYNMVHPLLRELKDVGCIADDRDHLPDTHQQRACQVG